MVYAVIITETIFKSNTDRSSQTIFLSEKVTKRHIPGWTGDITARPRPGLSAHKGILLLATAIAAVRLDEQTVSVVRTKSSCMLEEDVGFSLAHLAEDNDVVRILSLLAPSGIWKGGRDLRHRTRRGYRNSVVSRCRDTPF